MDKTGFVLALTCLLKSTANLGYNDRSTLRSAESYDVFLQNVNKKLFLQKKNMKPTDSISGADKPYVQSIAI